MLTVTGRLWYLCTKLPGRPGAGLAAALGRRITGVGIAEVGAPYWQLRSITEGGREAAGWQTGQSSCRKTQE